MAKCNNLVNQRFGRLLVLNRAGTKSGHATWKCLCDCGKETIVIGSNLTSGKILSCGCYKKEKQAKWGASTGLDLTGQRFGELIVLERALDKEKEEKRQNPEKKNRPLWKCQCSCGNITYVHTAHLRNNSIRSCGHIFSHGNQKILNILQENNISYIKEFIIKYNNKIYRYDFAIIKKDRILCLIEYDGEQHFHAR